MSRQTKETTVDGVQYRVTQVGGETGGEFIFRVGRVVAAAIDGTQSLFVTLQALPPAEFNWAIGVLKSSTEVLVVDEAAGQNARGETPARWVSLALVYDDHFAGRWGLWRKWIAFAAEVSFGSFFGDLLAEAQRRRAASSSTSPKTSTGSAGESSPTTG